MTTSAPARTEPTPDALAAAGSAVLYVSYDGVMEPLGQSQVLAYLVPLAAAHRITLLSWEKPSDLSDVARTRETERRLAAHGIRWLRRRYHKRPALPATAADVLTGIAVALAAARRERPAVVHARGYVASLVALAVKRVTGASFVFDMRGFWPDERVDAGQWTERSLPYRLAKRCERVFFEKADAIVSLTRAGVAAFPSLGYRLAETTSVVVIPTCADLDRFAPGPRPAALAERLGLGTGPVIGCVGTLSNWYLRDATLAYVRRLLERLPEARALFVTREDHDALRRDARAAGTPDDRLVVTAADHAEMPDHVRLMDLGVFFIRPSFAKRASAATKLAEFLGTGVPVVINDGVGDSGDIVRAHGAGLVVPDVAPATMDASLTAATELLSDQSVRARCREAASRCFDLGDGVVRYHTLYTALAAGRGNA